LLSSSSVFQSSFYPGRRNTNTRTSASSETLAATLYDNHQTKKAMYKLVGLAFCAVLGISVAMFGWTSLLWTPLGFIIGLFASANIILPILMGVPIATSYVTKKEMRSGVYFALVRAPLIWCIPFLVLAIFFPSALHWITANQALCMGLLVGFVAILLSPLSSKGRQDFRSDFDKSYGRYYTNDTNFTLNYTDPKDKSQLKQIEAVIRISSNLYFHTFSNASDVLRLHFNDGRFRCLIFCLTATMKACEEEINAYERVQRESLHFLANIVNDKERGSEIFTTPTSAEQAEKTGEIYLREYVAMWKQYDDALSDNEEETANDILCSMIHACETDEPLNDADKVRLKQLCWEVEFSIKHGSMKKAFINLMSK